MSTLQTMLLSFNDSSAMKSEIELLSSNFESYRIQAYDLIATFDIPVSARMDASFFLLVVWW